MAPCTTCLFYVNLSKTAYTTAFRSKAGAKVLLFSILTKLLEKFFQRNAK